MALHLKRGIIRLWFAASISWTVFISATFVLEGPSWPERPMPPKKSTVGSTELSGYPAQSTEDSWMDKYPLAEEYENTTDNSWLDKYPLAEEYEKSRYDAEKSAFLEGVLQALAMIIIAPLLVLLFGLVIGWVVRGFIDDNADERG